jgi:hypothetical protein
MLYESDEDGEEEPVEKKKRRKRRKRRRMRRRTITNQTLTMLNGSRDRGPAVLRGVCCTG